jgi:transcriptional regulator with XRE-family HTH domain
MAGSGTTSPIPKRLKEARLAANLSQKELGIRAGFDEFVASARMNQYETGKHQPNFQTLRKIGEILGLDPAFFYCENNELAAVIKQFSTKSRSSKRPGS